jgi:predicted RecB family nuclease
MKINPELFEAYLKCPTKCFLLALGETATGNTYANWVRTQIAAYRSEASRRLTEGATSDECVTGLRPGGNLKFAKWKLAIDLTVGTDRLESTIHAVERVASPGRGEPTQFIPIRFIYTDKITNDDRLLLAFDALVLSESLGREAGLGKILHGHNSVTLMVKTGGLASDAWKATEEIDAMLASDSPPDLVLNRHCAECEFQSRCRQKAIETDDLSLISGMTENERARHRSKGIFTVKQLSYTFRPRKAPKWAKNPARPRYLALQALAIRENTVYVHGQPQLPRSKTQVYLDIEGLPGTESYYLIGALVVSGQSETYHSFWADLKSDEPLILVQFAEAMRDLSDAQIFHYGKYERVALLRMKEQLSEQLQPTIDVLLKRLTNVVSVIHPHVYFPTFSNSLKEVGRFLGFDRADEGATGLDCIVWRNSWQVNQIPDIKTRLLHYNRDDCFALRRIVEFIKGLAVADSSVAPAFQIPFKNAQSEDRTKDRPHWDMFRPREYASEDFKKVAQCAYFDYQREKVYVRTHEHFKVVNKRDPKSRRLSSRVNKAESIESQRCPHCQSRKIEKAKQFSHDVIDLKFFRHGVKKWITHMVSWRYSCLKCGNSFRSEECPPHPTKYGHGLMSWLVYCNVSCGMNMLRAERSLAELFGLSLPDSEGYRSKKYLMSLYQPLYAEILKSILAGPILHIDETTVNLRKQRGYVWVVTSIDKAYYFYKPTREGSFLQELLSGFHGVLISDFFTAYDSLNCEQQKCLVHLIREIDDDLFRNPLDVELKGLAQEFGAVLRTIIETVDRRGLKSRYLRKHKRSAMGFLRSVTDAKYSSSLAIKYQKRFQKSGGKLFTFLDHDGVPWNNNNAEHAIKLFAKYRRNVDGYFTERTLKEYLVLATVFETCAFNNVNVLKFMLTKETRLEGLLMMAGRTTADDAAPRSWQELRPECAESSGGIVSDATR